MNDNHCISSHSFLMKILDRMHPKMFCLYDVQKCKQCFCSRDTNPSITVFLKVQLIFLVRYFFLKVNQWQYLHDLYLGVLLHFANSFYKNRFFATDFLAKNSKIYIQKLILTIIKMGIVIHPSDFFYKVLHSFFD